MTILEKKLPDIHEKVDEALTEVTGLHSDFVAARDKFVKDNEA